MSRGHEIFFTAKVFLFYYFPIFFTVAPIDFPLASHGRFLLSIKKKKGIFLSFFFKFFFFFVTYKEMKLKIDEETVAKMKNV